MVLREKLFLIVTFDSNKHWKIDFYGRRNCTTPSLSGSHNSWFVDLSYIMIRLGGSPELLASSRRNLWSRKQPATSWLSRPKCGFERPPSREHYHRTSSARELADEVYFSQDFCPGYIQGRVHSSACVTKSNFFTMLSQYISLYSLYKWYIY